MTETRRIVDTPAAPRPRGHYSQAIRRGNMVFVSGQLPVVPGEDETRFPPDMEGQALQVMQNVQAILEAAGATLADIVNVQVLVPGDAQWGPFNRVYARFMGEHRPARTVIRGSDMPIPGVLVEVTVTAMIGEGA